MRELSAKQSACIYLLLAVLCVITYWPGMRGPFVFDDTQWASHFRFNLHGLDENGYWDTLLNQQVVNDTVPHGRPLLKALFVTECYLLNFQNPVEVAANHTVYELVMWPFHAVSLFLHLANVLPVYLLLRRLMGPKHAIFNWLVTAIWALHPIQTDAVLYISQQSELLVSFFMLATLNCALAKRWLPAVILCAIGMLAKELMLVTPLLVVLAMSIGKGRYPLLTLKKRPGFYAALFGTCIITAALMLAYPRSQSTGNIHGWDNWTYLLTQSRVLCYYLLQCVWPTRLAIDPYFAQAISVSDILPFGLTILSLLVLTGWLFVKRHRMGFWAAWFFVILAPTSSFVPITTEIAALRRMYLPLLGVMVMLAWSLRWLMTQASFRVMIKPVLATVTLVFALLTWQHAHAYQSQIKLYEDNAAKFPDNQRAMRNMAAWYYQDQQFEKAVQTYDRIITQWPDDAVARYDRATALIEMGQAQQAITDLKQLLEQLPKSPAYHCKLGIAYRQVNEIEMAEQCFIAAIKLAPIYSLPKQQLAYIRLDQGQTDRAIHWLEQAVYLQIGETGLKESSGARSWNELGLLYARTQQYDKALHAFFNATCFYNERETDAVKDAQFNIKKLCEVTDQTYPPKLQPMTWPMRATELKP
ncbi:MAG: tetratricopeptide repeat protein [Phycisphaeraceae bacterium JB051]